MRIQDRPQPLRHLLSTLFMVLVSGLLLLSHTPLQAAIDTTRSVGHKKILIIHSYHKGLSWTDSIDQGIRQGLKDLPNAEFFTEYMGSKRQKFAVAKGPFGRYLRAKYQDLRPDLIIVSDNNALRFLAEQPVENFIGVPLVFCGIDTFTKGMLKGLGPQVTGTVEKVDPAATIKLLKRLQPKTKRLFIVSGTSPSAKRVRTLTERILSNTKTGLALNWWSGLGRQELLDRLADLGPDDAVLLLLFNRDRFGTYFSYKEGAHLISSSTRAPVYSLWDCLLGTGVIGGRMVSGMQQGATAASLARNYFKDNRFSEILTSSPNVTLFDPKALSLHGIKEDSLPSDAILKENLSTCRLTWCRSDFATILGCVLGGTLILTILIFWVHPWLNKRTELIVIINRSVLTITSGFILCLLLISITAKYVEHTRSVTVRKEQLLEAKKQTLVVMVEQAVHLINQGKKQHDIPLPKMQQRLLKQISSLSFQDGSGYLFVLRYDGVVLSHGADPTLVGQDISQLQDPDGVYPAREIIRLAKQNTGAFVSYLWPKPKHQEAIPKLSYAMGIPDWKWAIGCGLYLDDINLMVAQERHTQQTFFLQELAFLIATALFALSFLYLISRRLNKRIQKEIASLEQGLRNQDHSGTKLLPEQYHINEFGNIASGVRNAFSDLSLANDELLAKEIQFIDALQASPDAMLLMGKGSFIACNQAAATLLGYADSRLILHLRPSDLSPARQPDGRTSAAKAEDMVEIAIGQGTTRFEWVALRHDSSPIFIEVTLTPAPVTAHAQSTIIQCVLRDLTQEKELGRQMRQIEEQRRSSLEDSERMNHLMRGREERILEIKEEVNTLLGELRRKPKYGQNHASIIEAPPSNKKRS